MASEVKPVPEGFGTVTPHLIVKGAAEAIDFYTRAFGAEELCRLECPQTGGVGHAELRIGASRVMLCEEFPQMGGVAPPTLGGSPVSIHLYVDDADAVFDRAVQAGATVAMPLADMFWGDRFGKLVDPFGHHWSVATHVEDVTPEQMRERMAAMAPAVA